MGENSSLDTLSSFKEIMPSITIGYDEVPLDADLLWLLFLLLLSLIWFTYILYYNSRLFGLILTKLMNNIIIPKYLFPNKKKCEQPYLHIGSFSVTLISGKFMFRDLVYVTPDFSLHIQDGWIIFRWWLKFEPSNIRTNDFSHSDARLSLFLNGYELHIYNRSDLYAKLEKLFGIYPSKLNCETQTCEEERNVGHNSDGLKCHLLDNKELIKAYTWRNFFPLTKIEIISGRFVFGNHLIPSTLLITFEEAHITYTSRPAVSCHDLFTHIAKAKAESFKVILAPSPKYNGINDEPPRFMGEGFVVFQANSLDLYYYQDEPGIVSSKPEKVELPTGDIVERFTSPAWGLDIKCGKGTHFSYGPWADRQRYEIYKFFFPQDYQKIDPTLKAKSGELRQFETFYIRLSTLADAAIDTLFQAKDKETKALHINAGPGSYLEISFPWITKETGYHSHIVGQILHLDATTNLDFRSLAESETLEFNLAIVYPRLWNGHQTWTCSITGCKATIQLIYAHKIFFSDLIDDWASKDRPDILQFVPYTWKLNIILKDFELITIENDYNWIDCSTKFNNENSQLAICGDSFDLSVDLPFDEFLPVTVPVKIWIQGESLFASLYFPKSNPHHDNIHMLHKFAKLFIPSSNSANLEVSSFVGTYDVYASDKKWRSATKDKAWIDCWSVPIVALSITYTYHPIPPKATLSKDSCLQQSVADISTPEREELLLDPIRPESLSAAAGKYQIPKDFNPASMDPDLIEIDLEVGPSNICLYGSLFRLLWNLKENYVGEYQQFTDFNSNFTFTYSADKEKSNIMTQESKSFDSRNYRPLTVTVSATFHDIYGHLMKSCDENEGSPCPCIYLERLCFEMNTAYKETKMQLIISPVILQSFDKLDQLDKISHLNCGFVVMESLLFRGHAMLSNKDRPLESETLEYAWLVEVQIGNISGRLTLPQFYNILIGLENFFLQVVQEDCSLQPPVPYRRCLHDTIQSVCFKTQEDVNNKMCPYSEDLKYRLIRISLDLIDIYFAEDNTLMRISVDQIRFATCNLHSGHTSSGITALVKQLTLKHCLMKNKPLNVINRRNEANETTFYEVAKINLGPVFIDSAELLSIIDNYTTNQNTFLRIHDKETKRLWFLWPNKAKVHNTLGKCGCVGGCYFYNDKCSRKNFFSLDHNLISDLEPELLLVESLLNPNEPVLRYKQVAIPEEIDDLESPLEPSFIFDKTNTQIPSSLSSLTKAQMVTSNNDSQALSFSLDAQKKNRFYLFNKQLSNPVKSDKNNLPISSSISPLGNTFSTFDCLQFHRKSNKIKSNLKQRSLSDSNDVDKTIEPVLPLNTSNNPHEKVTIDPHSSNSSLNMIKTISSQSTLIEPYFSADDAFSSDSDSLTLVTAPSNPITSGKSVDTSNSFSSNCTLEPISLASPKEQDLTSLTTFTDAYQSLSITSDPFFTANSEDVEISLDQEADIQSLSNNSFRSAVSSQDEISVDALVDLRNQMEKPIIESPLLMSSYNNNLTKFVCKNFFTNQIPQASLTLNSWKKFIPKLVQTSNHGFSCLRVIDKSDVLSLKEKDYIYNSHTNYDSNTTQYCFAPGNVYNKIDENDWAEKEKKESKEGDQIVNNKAKLEKQISKMVEFRNEKLTILIKFTEEVDIRLSPLCLDGLKTFIESLSSTFAKLHPLSILNHLNLMCFNRVRSKNTLKKEKILEFGQLKLKAWKSTLERERVFHKTTNSVTTGLGRSKLGDAIMDVRAHLKPSPAQSDITANQYAENKNSEFQVFISFVKINIIVLQASLIEEFIYFSALDDVKDLTCVSLFSLSISEVNFDLRCSTKKRRSLHTIISNVIQAPPTSAFAQFAQSDIVSRLLFRKPKKERAEVEPITIETDELLEQETVAMGGIGSLHGQLNRLKNNSTILKEAILTVVPESQSKVNFKYEKGVPSDTIFLKSNLKSKKKKRRSLQRSEGFDDKAYDSIFTDVHKSKSQTDSTDNSTNFFGFIMLEYGLENISLKAVKRSEIEEPKSTTESDQKDKEESEKKEKKPILEKNKKGASSLIGEIGIVWFNFAAPPKTPNTRRIDFTRLDWHLLSTATPSINAWLSVGDRFIFSLKKAHHLHEQRITSVVIYLMIAALEVEGIHIAPSSKYIFRKLTPFSKALQEDPSCQLMSVLRRYLNRYSYSIKELEKYLLPKVSPSLSVLKRGVIALSRQWKNALYMPLLVEQNIRFTRGEKDASSIYQSSIPLRVLFENKNKPPQDISIPYIQVAQESTDDIQENVNEKSDLLQPSRLVSRENGQNERISQIKKRQTASQPDILVTTGVKNSNQTENNDESVLKRKLSTLPNLFPRSSKGSTAFPLLSNPFESIGSGVGKAYGFLFNPNPNISSNQFESMKGKVNESQTSLKSLTSSSLNNEVNNCSLEPALVTRHVDTSNYHEENLYSWMARQQDYMEAKNITESNLKKMMNTSTNFDQSRCNTLESTKSCEENIERVDQIEIPPGFVFVPTGVKLGNARIIFQPLFSSLGLDNLTEEGETTTTFDQLDPHISFSGTVQMLKVNIVESDFSNIDSELKCENGIHFSSVNRSCKHVTLKTEGSVSEDSNLETLAFICDQLTVDLDLRKVKNFKSTEMSTSNGSNINSSQSNTCQAEDGLKKKEKMPIVIIGPDGDINETTTMVNFNVNINQIDQKVNLSLLRLLHQFESMIESIKETRIKLKANQDLSSKWNEYHHKKAEASDHAINIIEESQTSSCSSFRITIDDKENDDIDMIDENRTKLIPPTEGVQAKCWKTMYYLLDLYDTTPETKTVSERVSFQPPLETKITIEESDDNRNKMKNGYEQLKEYLPYNEALNTPTFTSRKISFESSGQKKQMTSLVSSDKIKTYTHALIHRELSPLIIFGVVTVKQVNSIAMLGGLKLDVELSAFHVSLTHKEKFRGAAVHCKKWKESSLTGQLGHATLSLLEEVQPTSQKLVVEMTVGKSDILLSSQNKKGKDANSAFLSIGPIMIDIPQHPVALHGMMTRSSRQLSTTLQELRSSRQPSRSSRQPLDSENATAPFKVGSLSSSRANLSHLNENSVKTQTYSSLHFENLEIKPTSAKLIKPIVFQFTLVSDSLTIEASLLPSLRARYAIGQVTSNGMMGSKAKFVVDVRKHTLSFNTLLKNQPPEPNLPSSASVSLPIIHVSAEYMEDIKRAENFNCDSNFETFTDGIVFRKGSYLDAIADIGAFEHSLTTDLLNHLLLVQKVFMKEVNEVVQKVSGYNTKSLETSKYNENDKFENDFNFNSSQTIHRDRHILFSLHLRLQGIQITTTTPTNSAVRLETGPMELQLSNRVQNMSSRFKGSQQVTLKMFFKLQVDLNVALGQLIKNALFEEADPEFQQLAYFKTRIAMRNAFQDELVPSSSTSSDKEAVLITLRRPLVYLQPLALDKAVLVWINYKNAYEYWNEQRANLNKEVISTTQQVLEKVRSFTSINNQTLGTLFLQLTIDDLGICLPISNSIPFHRSKNYDSELKSALVVTLENTRISACSCGSLVSKAGFTGLCLRFVDDFETSLDDWKPDPSDQTVMNLCVVSEGTYEICSKTFTHSAQNDLQGSDAKWVLNVSWRIEGFDIHVDTSIGKQFSALFKTLTAIAGEEDEADTIDCSSVTGDNLNGISIDNISNETDNDLITPSSCEIEMPNTVTRKTSLFKDSLIYNKQRSRLIEKKLNEQAKIINDLRQLGASENTIEQEKKRLRELESVVFNDFKRDVINKFRRQSLKRSFREKVPLNKISSSIAEDFILDDQEPDTLAGISPECEVDKLILINQYDQKDDQKRVSLDLSKEIDSKHDLKKDREYFESKDFSKSLLNDGSKGDQDQTRFQSKVFGGTTTPDASVSSTSLVESFTAESNKQLGSSKTNLLDENIKSVFESENVKVQDSTQNIDNDQSKTPSFINKKQTSECKSDPSAGISKSSIHQIQDPNIDFELDVKIFFNSGKCVFHARDSFKDKEDDYARKNEVSKESGNENSSSSSSSQPRNQGTRSSSNLGKSTLGHSNLKFNLSSSRLKYAGSNTSTTNPNQLDFTLILIPGLDIKVHYNSKTVFSNQAFPATVPASNVKTVPEIRDHETNFLPINISKRGYTKKASCYAWMTLHSIPEETIITPHILDFMEQALEPIPIQIGKASEFNQFNDTSNPRHDLITSAPAHYAVYGSFPVDVIVYLHMQPSVLRFSCLPVSRVECLLQLPSVDLVFSSKRLQDELDPENQSISGINSVYTRSQIGKYNHKRSASDYRSNTSLQTETSIGGLSMTGCLADFSLYIFHPYGGQKKITGFQSESLLPSTSSSKMNSDRKDSLSLQVEFVKINISRSRKLVCSFETTSPQAKVHHSAHFSQDLHNKTVMIRFSAFCDIGSASFKYDMRRLTEILAFPRAWYRKALWKRMFLGDHSIGARNISSDQEDYYEESNALSSSSSSINEEDEIKDQENKVKNKASRNRDSLWLNLDDLSNSKENKAKSFATRRDQLPSSHSSSIIHSKQIMSAPWKTLILFGVNLCKLNVHMNMGNVMGNTSWLTRGFRSEGRISIDSDGDKCFNIELGLDGSSLDAKGGIVGGIIELSQIQTKVNVNENYGKEPNHSVTLKLDAFEKRLDYMGASILMLRVSDLDLTLTDEWRIDAAASTANNHPTKRAALIFIHCNLFWDQLQLLISKSTTPDIIKIIAKLEEFFSQQFHSSKRVFSSLQPLSFKTFGHKDRRDKGSLQNKTKLSSSFSSSDQSYSTDARHHRHWQKVLKLVSNASLSTLSNPLPNQGTILGGTVELNGNNMSLACFYGINFRSKSWALFSMRQPSISFASEAQNVCNSEKVLSDTHIIQNFNFSLGRRGRPRLTGANKMNQVPSSLDCFYAHHSNMATVCRISRTVMFSPQFKTMHEWFQYAFASSDLDQINRFPVIEFERSGDGFGSVSASLQSNDHHNRRLSVSPKSSESHQNKEIIFALPSFQVDLKTEHLQSAKPPTITDPKPRIDCTFVTDFDDHIFVAVDAESYFFLHELITSYIKEKQGNYAKNQSPISSEKFMNDSKTEKTLKPESDFENSSSIMALEKDWREFNCQLWHLEPTVRLITWAGKNIEPYGVEFILQKLGFAQARITIPKWIQRGAMDPLDKVLSSMMFQTIHAIKNEPNIGSNLVTECKQRVNLSFETRLDCD